MAIKQQIRRIFKDPNYREILHGSAWSFGTRIIGLAFGYLNTFLIARFLGAGVVGLFNLTVSIFAFLTLFVNLGFSSSIVRFVGQYQDKKIVIEILKKIIWLSLPIALAASSLIIIFSKDIAVVYFHMPRLKNYLILFSIAMPISLMSTFLLETIRGYRKVNVSETIRNSASFFNFAFLMLLIFVFRINYLAPPVSNLLITIVMILLSMIFFNKIVLSPSKLKNVENSWNEEKKVIKYKDILDVSLPMFFTSSMFTFLGNTDKLMLGYFGSSSDVGIYSVSMKLSMLTVVAGVAISTILAPKIAQLYWDKKNEELKKIVTFSARLFFYTSVPVMVFYFLFPSFVLSLFGKEFVAGRWILIILAFSQLINAFVGPVGNFLMMTGSEKVFRNIVAVSAMVNIVLNYFLIPILGGLGAAIATGFSTALWNVWSLIYIWKKFKIYTGFKF